MSTVISRPRIPDLDRKDLFAYLRKHCKGLIAQKKAFSIKSDDLEFGYSIITEHKTFSQKAAGENTESVKEGELKVEVYANVAGWCDSYRDVMIKDNWNKSIADIGASGQKLFYHLKNHGYKTDDVVGKDASLFTKNINPSEVFNFKTDVKTAQALMMRSTVVKEYDPKVYMLYRDGQIKQHSIGLQYVKLYLCMDSDEPEDAEYKENWDKYYSQVLNKELVEKDGYFWAVTEAKILETSTVLYGANELTPVDSMDNNTKDEPPAGTQPAPLPDMINWEKMASLFTNN